MLIIHEPVAQSQLNHKGWGGAPRNRGFAWTRDVSKINLIIISTSQVKEEGIRKASNLLKVGKYLMKEILEGVHF